MAKLVDCLGAAALAMAAVPAHAECPPKDSRFAELAPIRLPECAEGDVIRKFERAFVFTDGSSIYIAEMGRKLAFSTAYTVSGQKIAATTQIRDLFTTAPVPSGEKGPYAIVDSKVHDALLLIGHFNGYQLSMAPEKPSSGILDWNIVTPRISIERGHMWWLTDDDSRIAAHPTPGYRSYSYLVPIYCNDFDFAVQLPGVERLAVISSTHLTVVGTESDFSFNDGMTPSPGFYVVSRKLHEASIGMDVKGNRVIGSVAAVQDGARLWLRLHDAPSEGDEGRSHYVALVQGADGSLSWLWPANGSDQAPFWCF